MTVLERLEQVRCLDLLIEAEIEEERRLREMATSITAPIGDGMPHTPSVEKDKIGIIVAKIIDLQQKTNADIDEFVDMKAELKSIVKKLPAEERTVITLFYFKHMTTKEIAAQMHCSVRTVFNIKERAITKLEEIV